MGLFDFNSGMGEQDGMRPQDMGLLALASGMVSGNMGGGLLHFAQMMQSGREQAMKQKYMDAQMANLQSEIEARKLATVKDERQQKLMESFFPGLGGGAPAAGGGGTAAGGMGGAPSPLGAGAVGGGGGNDILALAQKLGIPPQAIQADIVFNGGKKISELLDKHGSKDMQVTGNFAYDKNAIGAGFMPSLSQSQNGQTSMTRIGPDGLPVVSAPQGALATYDAYNRTGERGKADYDPLTIPPRAGEQNPTMTTRGAFVGSQQPQASLGNLASEGSLRGAAGGQMGPDPNVLRGEIQKAVRDLTTNPNLDPASRKMLEAHVVDMSQQLKAIGVQSGVQANPGGIPLQSEAEKIQANAMATGQAERDNATLAKGAQFKDFRDQLGIARTLLKAGPTHSTIGAGVDSALSMVGQSTSGAQIAKQLDLVGGWMTQNIPKAPGAQSNYELSQYQASAGDVGNKTLPVEQRLAALDTLEKLVNTWETRRAGGQGAAAASNNAAPVRIKGEGDYAALPSGAIFVDPFGKTRRKP